MKRTRQLSGGVGGVMVSLRRHSGNVVKRKTRMDFRTLADATSVMIWNGTLSGRLTYVNQPWLDFTGSRLADQLGDGWKAWVHPDDRERCNKTFAEARKGSKGFTVELRMMDHSGSYRQLSLNGVARRKRSRALGFAGTAVDITREREAENNLHQYQERYRAFVETSGEGIWRFETATPIPTTLPPQLQVQRILHSASLAECNTALARFFGYDKTDDVLGASIRLFVRPDQPDHMEFLNRFVREGYRLSDAQVSYRDKTGGIRYLRASFYGIVEDGYLVRAWGRLSDVTDRTIAERKLLLLAQTITSARDCISITDLEDRILFVNDAFIRTYGYSEEQLLSSSIAMVRSEDNPPELMQQILPATMAGGWYGELINRRADGTKFPVELWTSMVRNADGDPVALVGVARDITERRRAEEQIKESLHEKEVLLKEIHHRVKNNMQVISSLLSLQSEYLKDETIVRVLRESQNRVKSMALIHEKLYQSKNLAVVDFGEYLRELSTQIFRSYGFSTSKIGLNLDIENVSLGVDRAIPCGIIVNELVSNALKYAFPNGKGGTVALKLRESPQGRVELVIQDNGVGMPPGVSVATADTLGLSLVRMLTEQIQGELLPGGDPVTLQNDVGTAYTLSFPK